MLKRRGVVFLLVSLTVFGPSGEASTVFEEWDRLEKDLRDMRIDAEEGRRRFLALRPRLRAAFAGLSFRRAERWVFPIEGVRLADSASPSSYRPWGFDFWDRRRQAAHPALDLFVVDRDRDSRDDKTGKPFRVVAPVDLVVLSVYTGWVRGSDLRGGNYVWAYHPPENLLLYFAHLERVHALPGRVVRAGEVLGWLGRTGRNAVPPRSDTHLHLMVLDISGDGIRPVNPWHLLRRR